MSDKNEQVVYCNGFSEVDRRLLTTFLSLESNFLLVFISNLDELDQSLLSTLPSLILLTCVTNEKEWDKFLDYSQHLEPLAVSILGLSADTYVVDHSLRTYVPHHKMIDWPRSLDAWRELPAELESITPLSS